MAFLLVGAAVRGGAKAIKSGIRAHNDFHHPLTPEEVEHQKDMDEIVVYDRSGRAKYPHRQPAKGPVYAAVWGVEKKLAERRERKAKKHAEEHVGEGGKECDCADSEDEDEDEEEGHALGHEEKHLESGHGHGHGSPPPSRTGGYEGFGPGPDLAPPPYSESNSNSSLRRNASSSSLSSAGSFEELEKRNLPESEAEYLKIRLRQYKKARKELKLRDRKRYIMEVREYKEELLGEIRGQ